MDAPFLKWILCWHVCGTWPYFHYGPQNRLSCLYQVLCTSLKECNNKCLQRFYNYLVNNVLVICKFIICMGVLSLVTYQLIMMIMTTQGELWWPQLSKHQQNWKVYLWRSSPTIHNFCENVGTCTKHVSKVLLKN